MLAKERGERGVLFLSFFICACSRFTPDRFYTCVWNQRSTFTQRGGMGICTMCVLFGLHVTIARICNQENA